MDLFTYLMAKNDHNTSVNKDLFSYLLGKGQSGTYQTFTGTSITANNTKKGKMKLKLMPTQMSQEGTPTPETPQPIHTISGDNEIVVCGKNLFEVDNTLTVTSKGFTFTSNGQDIIINGTYNGTSPTTSGFSINGNFITGNYSIYINSSETQLLKAGTYTASVNVVSGTYSNISLKLDVIAKKSTTPYTLIKRENFGTPATFTLAEDTECFIAITLDSLVANTSIINNLTFNIQLEKGNATSYEPYQSNSVLLTLGDKKICKIGNYEDKIFKAIKGNEVYDSLASEEKATLDYGKWYLRKNVGKVTLTSSQFNEKGTTGTNAYYISTTISNALNDNSTASSMSNKFGMVAFNNRQNGLDVTYVQNGRVYIRTKNNTSLDWSTNGNSKNWLDANTPIVKYILATPTNELFNDTIQEQLEDIYYNMLSYEGQTNVSQVNNDLAFEIEAEIKVGN